MRGRRRGARAATESVLSAAPSMRPGAVIGCCVSLLAAGVFLARGFVGVMPSRPVYLLLGGLLAGTALVSLVIDHVSVRVRAERPEHLLVAELDRSRRYGHPLSLVTVRCSESVGLRVVSLSRGSDRAWRKGGTLVLLLTGTDRVGATRFAHRLEDLVPIEAVRLASFPDDALTVDELYAALSPPGPEPAVADVVDLPSRAAPEDPGEASTTSMPAGG